MAKKPNASYKAFEKKDSKADKKAGIKETPKEEKTDKMKFKKMKVKKK